MDGVSSIYTDAGDAQRAQAAGGSISITPPDGYTEFEDFKSNDNSMYYFPAAKSQTIVNGTSYYASFEKAVAAAPDGAIVTLNQNVNGNYSIQKGQDITLDLNGYTLDGGTASDKAALTNYGTIVIVDSKTSGTIKRSDNGSSGTYYTILNEGTMTIKSGTVCNNSGSETTWSGSSLICNGSKQNATLNIMGGTFGQDNFIAIKNDEYGTLNISGGTITSKTQAVQNWKDATITGGTLTGIVSSWTYYSTQSQTIITGGTINGTIQACQLNYYGTPATYKPKINLSGNVHVNGNYIAGIEYSVAGKDDTFVEDETVAELVIDGGSYNFDPSDYLSDDYIVVQNNGVYQVWNKDEVPQETPDEQKTYTVTVNGQTVKYKAGETVSISAPMYSNGLVFSRWVVVSGNVTIANAYSNNTTFVMPEGNVEIEPVYTYIYVEPEQPEYNPGHSGSTGGSSNNGGSSSTETVMPENGFGTDKNGNTFFFEDGEKVKGWVQDGDTWYYMDSHDGSMTTDGWAEVDGTWYNFAEDGKMNTGWVQDGETWYYLKDWGGMATGWQQVDGKWYYLKDSGAMATGWVKTGDTWYLLKDSGAMATGWQQVNGKWYYLKASGAMATGWVEVNGKWYYLKADGSMATNTTINGYYVNADGEWVK